MPIERPRPFQTQVPLSNQFQVLGNIPKPSQVAQTQTSKQTSSFYIAKTHLMKIQILKSQHFNRFGLLDLSKVFSKGKYFIQNDPLKTRRFYEFILVDTDSIEVSHIQNQNTTNIYYSKCKIFKIIYELECGQSTITHKTFSQNFKPATYDYYDYMDAWFSIFLFRPFDHSWFFRWNNKIQIFFPNWFQEWWLYFGTIPTILYPQIKSSFDYFKEQAKGLILVQCSQTLFFVTRFQIPWILCWDFIQTHQIDPPFPTHLAHEFKVK